MFVPGASFMRMIAVDIVAGTWLVVPMAFWRQWLFGFALLVGGGACASRQPAVGLAPEQKIQFDLTRLDADGLRGPADGRVAVAYEFCIPNTAECRAQVRRIDAGVQFLPGSRGRLGAGPDECLCLGSTHQKHFRRTLRSLAALPYVRRIIECQFE